MFELLDMSSKTMWVVGWGLGWRKKIEIELGSCAFYPNSSQPGMFQTFAQLRAYAGTVGVWD